MPKVNRCTAKELIKLIDHYGFVLERQKGSHVIYKKDDSLIVVPMHHGNIKIGLLVQIIKQLGLSTAQFNKEI